MIIFGFRTMVKLLAAVNLVCRNCHNPAAQRVFQSKRWFTLFFIPVFPVSVSRSMTCTFCGIGTKLSKEEAEHLANGPGGPQPGQAPQYGQAPQQGQPQPGAWPPPQQPGQYGQQQYGQPPQYGPPDQYRQHG